MPSKLSMEIIKLKNTINLINKTITNVVEELETDIKDSLYTAKKGLNTANSALKKSVDNTYKIKSFEINDLNNARSDTTNIILGETTPSGDDNTAIGKESLYNNYGTGNTAIGKASLNSNAGGNYNTAIGSSALTTNHSGYSNIAIGLNSLRLNYNGHSNAGIGRDSLYSSTSGYNNAAIGRDSLRYLTTGYQNVAMGYLAGKYLNNGSDRIQTSFNSIYIGVSTESYADGVENEIVIGYNAEGNGSNSITLGADAITKTILKGQIGVGTDNPATSAAVDITSTTKALLLSRMTTAQRDALTAVNGMLIYNTSTNKFQGYENGSWVNLV